MNYKKIGRINGFFLLVEAFFMLPPLILCMFDGDWRTAGAFGLTILLIAAVSTLLMIFTKQEGKHFYAKEGLISTGIGWILLSLFGCLPFVFSKQIPHFIDALFETVSGFTTTGASVLSNVEGLTMGLQYWRCFTNWLGGMGVLVFILAIAPIGGDSIYLLQAESPGPNVDKLVPKMRRTATILYIIYIGLTLLDVLFLLCGEMNLYESVCTAFTTAGTGGFGLKNDSIAGYSAYTQIVCTVFMLLFGVNFSCYYLILIGQIRNVWKDEEFRLYWGLALVSGVLITVNAFRCFAGGVDGIRHAFFQVASIMTTTGYSTVDFDTWPTFSKAVLLCLMVVGASAGSTGGGLKCSRLLILLKNARRNLRQLVHPNTVEVIRVNDRVINERVVTNTTAYFVVYALILTVSVLIVSLDRVTFTTSFSAVLACFNNIGPGLDQVGPMYNYGDLSILSKLVLIFDMLAGRLEIFPLLILFRYSTWKRY
ncbi:MAG: TrkH family potassium uptake protein [Ruminococcaceae bacterium]|nr:TrkH family potassium uptake protein [Oscillospiraceae bacterium]